MAETKQQNKTTPPAPELTAAPPAATDTPPVASPPAAAPQERRQLTAKDVSSWINAADEVVPLLSAAQRVSLAQLLAGLRTPAQNVPAPTKSPYEPGKKYDFLVTHNGAPAGEAPHAITARDDIEAWAFYCELTKRALSPRQRVVKLIGETKAETSAA